MWPFERRAGRYPPASSGEPSGSTSQTDEVIDALLARAAGSSKDPEALAVAEAAVSLWERSQASATVEPRGRTPCRIDPGHDGAGRPDPGRKGQPRLPNHGGGVRPCDCGRRLTST